MDVWLNGRWLPLGDARVSAFDAGLQHGVGLFETMKVAHGRVWRLDDHLARLARSAVLLRLTGRLETAPLAEVVRQALERSGLSDARIRLTVTGGDLNLLARGEAAPARHDPTILVAVQPPTRYPEDFFTKGIRVTVADAKANPLDPFAGHKTLWYWPRLAELQAAAAKGAGEALWFSVTNHLACGCVSNAFAVRDGKLLTPFARGEEPNGALPSPVLPGVTRGRMLELAAAAGIPLERRMMTYDDLSGADEIFLTNTSWGVLPVVGVEAVEVGRGKPGPVTARLREAWLADLAA
jgi:branched-subunit amino acid aminotransferase/4-amino-4-deoxychorismate lyase